VLKGFIDSSLVFSVGGVKVVFDAVVRSTWKFFRDVCPLVSKPFMKIEYHPFFFLVYWILLYVRIKVVVPTKIGQIMYHLPFSTLFASSSGYFVLFL
jgi:hypothetical protein